MIKRFILHILGNGAALYAIVELLKGDFVINGGLKGFLIAALFFGILNTFIKPIIKILTLPFVFITAGLFTLVINTFLAWFAKYALDVLQFQGVTIEVGHWLFYLYVGVFMAIANMLIHWLTRK
ncbi:phage holin family protein [Patescibacteria group bacterium]|nr:phage holin family protein [Patescibacteria group bacterium]